LFAKKRGERQELLKWRGSEYLGTEKVILKNHGFAFK
jgi:hypothetical protein